MRRAFSLVELMIVIVIIGAVYALVISKVQTPQQDKKLISFKMLHAYLQDFKKTNSDSVALICKNNCQRCVVTCNGIKVKEITPFFDATVERFRYGYFRGLTNVDDGNCFALSVDGGDVSDQYIVLYKGKVYDFTNYFDAIHEYNSTDELIDAKANLVQVVTQ